MDQTEYLHRKSLRLSYYDYSQSGAYFVTFCASQHRQLFGEVQNGEMQLNAVGRVAAAQWKHLEYRFPEIELGEWIIMPNHIHGILIITGKGEASQQKSSALPTRSVNDASPLRLTGTRPGSIGAIIQNYKSVVSRKIAKQDGEPRGSIWQRNYYEHIIRNDRELQAITDYILTNPQNWEKDTEYRT
jgi:REP element-mobilizing transposase RayT